MIYPVVHYQIHRTHLEHCNHVEIGMAKQHHRSWLQVGAVSGQSLPKMFLIHDGSLRGVGLVRCCEAIEAFGTSSSFQEG